MLKTSTTSILPTFSKTTVIVVGVTNADKGLKISSSQLSTEQLQSLELELLGVSAKPENVKLLPFEGLGAVALVGLGSGENPDLRAVSGSIARAVQSFANVVIDLDLKSAEDVLEVIEGFSLANYQYTEYQESKKGSIKTTSLSVVTGLVIDQAQLTRISILAQSVHDTRDLVNQPPNHLYPASFVASVEAGVKGQGIEVTVWDEKSLESEGFGGIAAVGKGSTRPPRMVKLDYHPKTAKKHLALVGKGITFDSGGLSLKPAESMVGMKYDMTGAASVYQAVVAIAKLGLPIRATAWLCLAENLPSGSATRPNDIIKIRNGKTVEVLNTDAEGRLVLADGLSAASETHPDLIVDVATLTGAATIALGHRYAGLMGDAEAIAKVETAAKTVGELVWPMPLPNELRAMLDSPIADIANVKIGNRAGGMLIGGLFLKEFIGPKSSSDKTPISWAHLDIAGPANNDSAAYGHTPKGATGAIVRTLVQLAHQVSAE
jgi:leucyl aminopeptidase